MHLACGMIVWFLNGQVFGTSQSPALNSCVAEKEGALFSLSSNIPKAACVVGKWVGTGALFPLSSNKAKAACVIGKWVGTPLPRGLHKWHLRSKLSLGSNWQKERKEKGTQIVTCILRDGAMILALIKSSSKLNVGTFTAAEPRFRFTCGLKSTSISNITFEITARPHTVKNFIVQIIFTHLRNYESRCSESFT